MLLTIVLLVAAGFVSGTVNSVAGGGTFITFGALTFAGLPAIAANATASVIQLPGYITSTLAYRTDIKTFWRQALLLAAISAVGALCGALVLLTLDNPSFRTLVPYLLLGATAIFAAGPWLKPKPNAGAVRRWNNNPLGLVLQFATAVYGGFFGAGMGIMMLATLGLAEGGDFHRLNAMKNFLSNIIAVIAIAVFTAGGLISWFEAIVMIPAVALGGYFGVWAARRVPVAVMRGVVVVIGLILAVYYFVS
ncbi:MAG: sulfite exporter TauE/SafE family protein [Devosia sp.]